MTDRAIVSHDEWLAARKRLLAEEKAFTKARDRLSAARRELPWERIEDYVFAGPQGEVRLSDLFRGRSQLIIYHFMFHPDWNAACKSCSFWADNFERIVVHLNARDTNLAAVSRAPIDKLDAFKRRMGWSFEWVSCGAAGAFNRDFGVYFAPDETKQPGANYNYGSSRFGLEDAPGLSVFAKDAAGRLYHTYSTYARGLDMLNAAYHYLDIVPKGRDEAGTQGMRGWLRLRDEYAGAQSSRPR
ncbi:MAG TPA: DUF899 domain-containing protein [Stellaceae bacterium]|nr:DUF899 domain-containing protein [Stellaceae bacterium]